MAISLHTIQPQKGSKKSKKRIGRGLGSTGRTSGRGQKGQKSRAGSSGMQRLGIRKMMLATPKLRGFKSPHKTNAVVNVAVLAQSFKAGDVVTPQVLKLAGLIGTVKNGVKILGDGEIDVKLTIKGCSVSKTAAEKIAAAGGMIEA